MARILLVEDNGMNRDMLSKRLLLRDHQVLFALNGEKALREVESAKPDIVLMDINLPDMSGIEVAAQIRSRLALLDLPIIALTAHAMEGDRGKFLDAGFDEYEPKPVNFDRLLSKIASLTGARRAGA